MRSKTVHSMVVSVQPALAALSLGSLLTGCPASLAMRLKKCSCHWNRLK